MLQNIAAGKKRFQFFGDAAASVIDERTDDSIITGIFPVAAWLDLRIVLQITEIVHHIPRAINIKITKVIAIIPGLYDGSQFCNLRVF